MSTQGDKLNAIADAIREVDGTDEPIVANDFPDRIRSISPGVKSFNGRTGAVAPQAGDYTAEQVGAVPKTGGTFTGQIVAPSITLHDTTTGGPLKLVPYGGGITRLQMLTSSQADAIIFKKLSGANQLGIEFGGIISTNQTNGMPIFVPTTPTEDNHAVSKAYVDTHAFSVVSNAGAHNSIFRGKYLGSSVTAAQYAAIAAGTFDDLFIGDYWTINGIKWRIAAFDYYLGTGSTALTTHHAVIVPDSNLDTQKMNNGDVTTGGYVGSKMYTENIATARSKVTAAFSGHVLTHMFYLSDTVKDGKVSGSKEVTQDVVLMSERNVYGQTIMSSECANDVYYAPNWFTYDKTQFQLFALAPEFIQKERNAYWLRDVVTSGSFSRISSDGFSSNSSASILSGVRPAFSIRG